MNAEYIVTVGPSDAAGHIDLTVRTVRQFSSFGYGIALTATSRRDVANGYVLDVGGITLPPVTKQAEGPATSMVSFPVPLQGTVHVTVRRKDDQAEITINMDHGTLTSVDATSSSALFILETPAA